MTDLAQLAGRHDTDKAAHAHYLRNYEVYFAPFRTREVRLLELGVYHGGSLLLWRDYFERGLIAGLDLSPVQVPDPTGRIRIFQGGQQDTALLDRIAHEVAPAGFDIIIDDCSHIGALTRISFWHLFEQHLKSGGLYVIEDWGTGYWDNWTDGVRFRPPPPTVRQPLTRLTRLFARLQKHPTLARLPLAQPLLRTAKAATLRGQFRSHNYGMVGFVKELIDELGSADITHTQYGPRAPRPSKFRELHIAPSHLFIVKA